MARAANGSTVEREPGEELSGNTATTSNCAIWEKTSLTKSTMQVFSARFRSSKICQAKPTLWPVKAGLPVNAERCLAHPRSSTAVSPSLWLSALMASVLLRPACIASFRGYFTFITRHLPRCRPMQDGRNPSSLKTYYASSHFALAIKLSTGAL